MHSERNLDSGGTEEVWRRGEARRGGGGEGRGRGCGAQTVLLFWAAQQQSEMLKVDFAPELMQARCEWLRAGVKFKSLR